jgi:hypothetical protein
MSDTARVKCLCRNSIQRKRGPCAAAWLIIKNPKTYTGVGRNFLTDRAHCDGLYGRFQKAVVDWNLVSAFTTESQDSDNC